MKKALGGINALYPTPTVIVGAIVADKPNFIGEIVETHAEESALVDGKVDVSKVRPLLFDMNSVKYWSLGPAVGGCWSVGKQMKK
jgi:flavin reductase (DIM6/NTAB) family NADH-FMN oxidoreductase RutF